MYKFCTRFITRNISRSVRDRSFLVPLRRVVKIIRFRRKRTRPLRYSILLTRPIVDTTIIITLSRSGDDVSRYRDRWE